MKTHSWQNNYVSLFFYSPLFGATFSFMPLSLGKFLVWIVLWLIVSSADGL